MVDAPFSRRVAGDPAELGIDAGGARRPRRPRRSARSTRATFLRASSRSRATGRSRVRSRLGDAAPESRYVIFSSTKPVVAAAMWILMGEGAIDVSRRVADLVPEFAANGKDVITIEQVMLHTSGFPRAPFAAARLGRPRAPAGPLREVAVQLGAGHTLRVSPHLRALGARRADRAGHGLRLPRLRAHARDRAARACRASSSACPPTQQGDINTLVRTGAPATPDELEAVLGVRELPLTEVTTEALLDFNHARGVRGRRARRRWRVDRGRSRALLPGAAARPARHVEARSAGRRHVERAQLVSRLHGNAGQPDPRPRREGRRRAVAHARHGAHGFAAHVRAQRRGRSDRVGRSRDRRLVRFPDERHRRARAAAVAARSGDRQPRRQLRDSA